MEGRGLSRQGLQGLRREKAKPYLRGLGDKFSVLRTRGTWHWRPTSSSRTAMWA